jgi:hypothetical protein
MSVADGESITSGEVTVEYREGHPEQNQIQRQKKLPPPAVIVALVHIVGVDRSVHGTLP